MIIFVTGANGQLGHDVLRELAKRGYTGVGSDRTVACNRETEQEYRQLDITDKAAVKAVLQDISPEAVIHCAAWTNVDAAEEESSRALVRAVNAGGAQNMADAAKVVDAKLLYLSTDYVFDGQGTRSRTIKTSNR